ncbi:MAG: phospho-N-acetylmuramoyl-pentapeptide-transferase [Planctomycetota bacterium]
METALAETVQRMPPLEALAERAPGVCLAGVTAFAISAISGRYIIRGLKQAAIAENTSQTPIEDDRLKKRIEAKNGTPTMGGLIVLAGVVGSTLAWAGFDNVYAWILVGCAMALGLLGGLDDWMKVRERGHRGEGLRPRDKLLFQAGIGALIGLAAWWVGPVGQAYAALAALLGAGSGWVAVAYVGWSAAVVTTMANSTNISDGLDGLMSGLTLLAAVTLSATMFTGLIPLDRGPLQPGAVMAGAVFCAALGGACLGFLIYNSYPAQVFMGDVGSLAVGGGLGMAAIVGGAEILLPVAGLVFLVELGSSLLQIFAFHTTGRMILPIAPIHHIFEQKGWSEPTIVLLFYLLGTACAFATITLAGF